MPNVTLYAPGVTVNVITVTNAPLYPADATSVVQAAVDALPTYGGTILFPAAASPYLLGNIQCGVKAVGFIGEGGPGQSAALGHGATELMVKNGTVGITWGTPGGNLFRGPHVENLRVVAQSPAALGGLLFNGISGARLWNVTCSDFTGAGAYGRKYMGGASGPTISMFNEEHGCQASQCTIGIWGLRSIGLLVIGGHLDCGNNLSTIVAGTTGILWDVPSEALTVLGTRIECYAIGIDNHGEGLVVQGTRHEAFTIGIRSNAAMCKIDPGEMSNYSVGSGGVGIAVAGNRNYVNAQGINSVGQRVDHTGATNTMILDNNVWIPVL